MSLYDRIASLPVQVESVDLDRLELSVTAEFTRVTTVVRLRGGGEEGVGEDVVYDAGAHRDPPRASIEGRWSFADLSRRLGELDLFGGEPSFGVYRNYRRWAWESAALDLALRQGGTSLADAVERDPRPVRFVASPRSVAAVHWLELYPGLRFKLDPVSSWDDAFADQLASTGAVDVLDLKGAYRGTPVDQPPDPRLYRLVAEGFPDVWIEDPNLDDPRCAEILAPHRERITWDAVLHSVAEIESLAFEPRTINVKPSRFGSVRELFGVYEHCAARGIGMYGGGQFELGPGRGQVQYLASLFHADGPNDVAPGGYNGPEPVRGLPESPLPVEAAPHGFRWG